MLPLMQNTLHAAVLLLGAALASIPTSPSAVLIENNEVKVARALEKNQVVGKFHQHDMNRVMIYLQSGRQQFEYQDGRQPAVFDWKAGQVVWSPPSGMHSPKVLDHDFDIIEIELKNPGTDKAITGDLDPLKVDPSHYTLEFENPQVRVLRVKIPPHGVAPMHAHPTDRVTVFLTDQNFQTKDSTGKVTTVEHKAGDVAWGTPIEHTEQNLSDQPFEAVSVELKR
jgi:quercetin dioxygenase-like cupin family protein